MNEVLKWLAIFLVCGLLWFLIGLCVAWGFGRWMDVQRQLDERDRQAELEQRRLAAVSQNGHVAVQTASQAGADISAADSSGD